MFLVEIPNSRGGEREVKCTSGDGCGIRPTLVRCEGMEDENITGLGLDFFATGEIQFRQFLRPEIGHRTLRGAQAIMAAWKTFDTAVR